MPDPRAEEGAVPLVVIADSHVKVDWQEHVASNFDGTSHFRIFPTLLALMGYSPDQTREFYGQALTSPESDPLTFTPNYRASLGRDPIWRRVVRSELAEPPVADYAQMPHVDVVRATAP